MTTFYDKSTLAIHNKIVPGMVIKWLANLNFSAKMNALTVLMLVFSLGGGLFNAWSARDTVQLALESSLKDQVTGYAAMLSKLQASQDPKSFLSAATALLTGARWGENQSGYLFLVDENSRFVAYPPNPAMVGQSTPRVQINETGHDLSDSLQQVSRTQRPALIHYDYIKPGSSEVEHKASYLMPVGPYVLSAGIYLDAADEAFSGYIKKSLVVVAIIMVGMLLLVQWLSRAIRQQVTLSLAGLRRISERVLDQEIPVWGRDEFALINQELEQTRCQLAELLFHQRNSAQHVAAASMQMDCGVLQVTQAVVEQQGRLNELASAMEQMRASVQDVATQAVHCATETRDTAKSSAEGEKDVNTIIHSIERLCGELKGCAEGIDAVQQQVNSISNMVETINGISDQTNLLALNAAIEAARAGSYGRGFAVVADEVRMLAGRTQEATKDIARLIGQLQSNTSSAVERMSDSVVQAHLAAEQADAAQREFSRISTQTRSLSQHADVIATAAEEQSQVSGQVTDALLSIRTAVDETAQVLEELSQAGQSLATEAKTLEHEVLQYRLPA